MSIEMVTYVNHEMPLSHNDTRREMIHTPCYVYILVSKTFATGRFHFNNTALKLHIFWRHHGARTTQDGIGNRKYE